MKKIWWATRYFICMYRQIKDIRTSYICARVAYIECTDWQDDPPGYAVDQELSCWYE